MGIAPSSGRAPTAQGPQNVSRNPNKASSTFPTHGLLTDRDFRSQLSKEAGPQFGSSQCRTKKPPYLRELDRRSLADQRFPLTGSGSPTNPMRQARNEFSSNRFPRPQPSTRFRKRL